MYSEIVEKSLPNRRGVSYMIDQINPNNQKNQLPKEHDSAFSELEMYKHLRQAGINETQLRNDIIDPLLKCLGWDVDKANDKYPMHDDMT